MEILYSTFAASAIARLVEREYGLGKPEDCRLIRRGFNDNYAVVLTGRPYVLRLYLRSKYYLSGESDVRFELEMLNHLHEQGVPVSYPLPRKDGDLLGRLEAPEGDRFYALFTWAEGKPVRNDRWTEEHSVTIGETMARMHQAADRFVTQHSRYTFGLDTLLERPLRELEPHLASADPADVRYITEQAELIRNRLQRFEPGPGRWGFIHGDLHRENFHVTPDGRVTIFDFDHGGFGWRAYDLSVCWSGLPPEHRNRFLSAYGALQPLSDDERRMLPLFARARAIWNIGDILAMKEIWGASQSAPAAVARDLRSAAEKYPLE